jgi:site-specific DNA-cytosine methylase
LQNRDRMDRATPRARKRARGDERAAPRAAGGGRSARYEERRAARGSHRRAAPEWSDCASHAVLQGLQSAAAAAEEALDKHCWRVLRTEQATAKFLSGLKSQMDPEERALAASIMECARQKVLAAGDEKTSIAAAKNFLKPLWKRKSRRTETRELVVEAVEETARVRVFTEWLSREPKKDRSRDISKSKRILKGLATWPMAWLRAPGVVCYERAAGRARKENKGKMSEGLAKGVVNTRELRTAVSSPSDHYVLLTPGQAPRFLTVQEIARTMGVPEGGSLDKMLRSSVLSPTQAASCLGGGIHVGVARQLVRHLKARGLMKPGLTYGSAYSGIDMFAAAVEAEFGTDWHYRFASEWNDTTREALMAAWGARGLGAGHCHTDAHKIWARVEGTVDCYVTTPMCNTHSRRNHNVTRGDVCTSLTDVWRGLEYVREAKPALVVVENVNEPSAVGGITGLGSWPDWRDTKSNPPCSTRATWRRHPSRGSGTSGSSPERGGAKRRRPRRRARGPRGQRQARSPTAKARRVRTHPRRTPSQASSGPW